MKIPRNIDFFKKIYTDKLFPMSSRTIFFIFFFIFLFSNFKYSSASKPRLYVAGLPECQPYQINSLILKPRFLILEITVIEISIKIRVKKNDE